MKLTEEQRMAAYMIMLAEIKSDRMHWRNGFCILIGDVFGLNVYEQRAFKNKFPELFALRPKNAGSYWFEKQDWKPRKALLIKILTEYYG